MPGIVAEAILLARLEVLGATAVAPVLLEHVDQLSADVFFFDVRVDREHRAGNERPGLEIDELRAYGHDSSARGS